MRRVALAPAYALALWTASATGYLLVLTGLAARSRGAGAPVVPDGEPLRTVVLVPAHEEEAGLPATLAALRRQAFPFEPVVIADNCSDATAEVARQAGATVWERFHDDRGKGQALAWALERLDRERPETEAVIVVDADCLPGPGLFAALDGALRGGAQAAQAIYDVANPESSPTAALRWAAFALKHRLRPRGRAALGLSAGLYGTGMAFRAELLRAQPWRAFSISEDVEYHAQLARAGVRVAFVDGAWVTSAMPTSDEAAHRQQLRWESGNARMARELGAPLVAAGLRRRDANLVVHGLELALPPQTLLVPGCLASLVVGGVARSRPLATIAAATAAGQVVYVFAGLRLVGAPKAVYRALPAVPRLAARKLAIFGRVARGRGTLEWLRTDRESDVVAPDALQAGGIGVA